MGFNLNHPKKEEKKYKNKIQKFKSSICSGLSGS